MTQHKGRAEAMKHKTILAVSMAAFLAVLHFGAAQAAPQGDENFKATYIRTNIIKGKTTTDDVLARFGEPTSQTMSDSSETWTYQRGASAEQAPKKKRGGGFSALMGVVKGVAGTAYELAPEHVGGSASRVYNSANRAERAANSASAIGGADQAAEPARGAGASLLQINFTNGVVTSFSLR